MSEPIKWHTEWAMITNRYGKLLSYTLPRFNQAYASLKYQGYITKLLESKAYDVFIDLGASIGLFSQVASHYCHSVESYEAHPLFYGILLSNMAYFNNVNCNYKFVSNKEDIPLLDAENVIRPIGIKQFDTKKRYNIEVVELDDEIIGIYEDLNVLIKMDVEGSEVNVLNTSKEILKCPNIHWVIDIHDQHGIDIEEVAGFFKGRALEWVSRKVLIVRGVEK